MVIVHTYGLILFHFLMLMKIVLALKDADVQCRGLFLSTEFTKRRTHKCIVAYTSAILELKGEASKMGGDAPFGPKKGGGDVYPSSVTTYGFKLSLAHMSSSLIFYMQRSLM